MENEKPVDKQAELGLKSDPKDDGLRLALSFLARHGDTQFAPAAANIMARMDGAKVPGADYIDVTAPPAVVQQHVGKGEYLGVEVKPDEFQKSPQGNVFNAAQSITPIPQVGGKDPVGVPLPGQAKPEVAETVSVQPSSTSTAQPVEAPKK